jgi:hypothetical protein
MQSVPYFCQALTQTAMQHTARAYSYMYTYIILHVDGRTDVVKLISALCSTSLQMSLRETEQR